MVHVDVELARDAAEFKANHRLPYANCFAAALAASRQASLLTSDRDFSQIEKKLDILWAS